MFYYRLDLSDNGLSRIPTNCLSTAASANLVELDLSGNTIPSVALGDLVQRYRVRIILFVCSYK